MDKNTLEYLNKSIIPLLISTANSSFLDNKLAAILVKNNKMISRPMCNYISYKHNQYVLSSSIHAEANVILKNANKIKKNNINMVVIRINPRNELCNARPCYGCLLLLKKYNIKKVYYSVSSNMIICEKIKDMLSIHICMSTKLLDFKFSSNKHNYYINLLKQIIPEKIKLHNLKLFIKYNLNILIPTVSIQFKDINNISYVLIFNNDILISKAIII